MSSLFPLKLLGAGLVFSLLTGCHSLSDDPVIARVGGTELRQSDLDRAVDGLSEYRRAALEDTAARKEFVRELAEGRLIAEDARRRFGDETLRSRLAELSRRELCRYTQSVVVARRIGLSEAELRRWIDDHRGEFGADSSLPYDRLEKRAAETIRLKEGDLVQFYKEHSPAWTVPARIEISAVESGNRSKIQQAEAALKRGEPFSDVASRFSEHHTASRGGYFGWIAENENHFLFSQYPDLHRQLFGSGGVEKGEYTGILTRPQKQIIVRVDSFEPRRVRPFEEAEPDIRAAYLRQIRKREFDKRNEELEKMYRIEVSERENPSSPIVPEEVLVTFGKKEGITGEEFLRLKEEYIGQAVPSDSVILRLLLQWRLWEWYGTDLGIGKSDDYRGFLSDYQNSFWLKVGVDSVFRRGFDTTPEEYEEIRIRYPELFADRDFARGVEDAALLLKGDPEELKAEWLLFPGKYGADSAVAYGENFSKLFYGSRRALQEGVHRRYIARLEQEIGLRWVDTVWSPPLYRNPEEAIEKAQHLLQERKGAEAVQVISDALFRFPSPALKRDSLVYLLGKGSMDAGRPREAIRAFARYAAIYPEGVDFCRSLFISGFLLENDLKSSQEALVPLRRLLTECPQSELVRDAAYMVEDIECDHCKTAEFLKSIAPQSNESP